MVLRTIFFGNNILQLEVLVKYSDVKAIFTKNAPENFNFQSIVKISSDENIPLYTPKTIKKEKDDTAYNIIREISPDMIISGGYHLIVPEYIIDVPVHGTFNIHPAPLPQYRGQHVIQWQLINDEKETGTTIHYMVPELDAGDIVKESRIPIDKDDDAYTLWQKTSLSGAEMLEKILLEIYSGKGTHRKVQDNSKARHYNKRVFEDGRIDWKKNAREIYNLSRALVSPWPGAYFEFSGKRYSLDKIASLDDRDCAPGKIIHRSENKIIVGTGKGRLLIRKDQIRGYEGNLEEFMKGEYLE